MYDHQTEDGAVSCFDPNNMPEVVAGNNVNVNGTTTPAQENGFSSHDQTNNNTPPFTPLDHNNNLNNNNTNSQEIDFPNPNNNWTTTNIMHNNMNVSHEMGYSNFDETIHTTTSDLLTLLHLPRCNFASSSSSTLLQPPTGTPSLSFCKSSSSPPPPHPGLAFLGEMNSGMSMMQDHGPGSGYDPAAAATFPYDPLFHLNLPPQPSPLLRDLMFQSLPHHGYTTTTTTNGLLPTRGNGNGNGIGNYGNCSSLFGGMEDGEGNNNDNNMSVNMIGIPGLYQQQEVGEHMVHHQNGVFEFSRGASLDDGKLGKSPKHFVTERQRRQNFNDKYQTLRNLIPTPTKIDRASIVFDAIKYIEELKRTVGELKLLVEKKRIAKDRLKRIKTDDDHPNNAAANGGGEHAIRGVVDGAGLVKPDPDDEFAGSTATQLCSSWLQRKCKDTEVDVRIVDDEVTIKLVQRKKINCLLSVSRTLDDLQLDLRHVAGGHVGDYYSYLFNTKICEGSSVYASAIANKLIEVVERQYAAASVAVAPTTSF